MELAAKFPKRLTVATVVLTLGIIVGLGNQQWNALRYIGVLKDLHIPTTELTGTIVHLDDVLTDSAYLSLLTGQYRWEERYNDYRPAIDYSTHRLFTLLEGRPGTPHLDRKVLFELEGEAFALAKKNRLEDAFMLLDSERYRREKDVYKRAIYDITGELSRNRTEALKAQYRIGQVTLVVFLVSLGVLITTGVILVRLLHQAEQQRKKMHAQLAQASKLTSLGTLSSGIAHELRSPLTVVKGVAQQIEANSKSASIRKQAKEIVDQSLRIQEIADHLRSFAREGGGNAWKALDLNEPVNRSLALLKQQLANRGIEVRLSLAKELPQTWGLSSQLESIFHNLVSNSRDAFEGITDDREKVIEVSTKAGEQGGVEVTVRDNASGMTDEVKDKMFDPFFTTKGEKGTGLGLAIVHGIVEQHRGTIRVESKAGKSTAVTVRFPRYVQGVEAPAPKLARAAA